MHNVPISAEHGLELYQTWIDQAVGSLISAVATKRLPVNFFQCIFCIIYLVLTPSNINQFLNRSMLFSICSKRIEG